MTYSRGQTISVKNIDSVDAPAFALLYVADSESRDDELVLHVRRPSESEVEDSTAANYVFNVGVVIPSGRYGSAKTSSLGFVLCENIGTQFSELGPSTNSWYLDGNATKKMFSFVAEDPTAASLIGAAQTALIKSKSSNIKLTRFTLTAALTASGTAGATIVSYGADNGTSITVSDHAGNAGESGDKGIAWKDGDTYWVIEIKAATEEALIFVRFTLDEDIDPTSHLAGATINGGPSDSETIEVEDWQYNGGRTGDQGIAWKDGTDYYIVEIKRSKSSELVRFTLEEDIDTASHLAGATIVSSGEDDGESIEVIDWCRNGGKEGDNGIAWQVRNSETGASEYYIVEIKQKSRVQFIQGTTSTAGDFESVAADSFSLQAIVGVDREWDGDETITVHNPLKIKVWDSDCVIKCQWNQDEERYEVLAATQKYVMHGVRIYKFSTTCRFEKLDSTGISNWNDETFPDVITTSPNWVTEVYVAGTAPNQTLRYKTYCMDVSNTGVQILEIGNACP